MTADAHASYAKSFRRVGAVRIHTAGSRSVGHPRIDRDIQNPLIERRVYSHVGVGLGVDRTVAY